MDFDGHSSAGEAIDSECGRGEPEEILRVMAALLVLGRARNKPIALSLVSIEPAQSCAPPDLELS